jgi:hypothetical protein
MECDRIRPSVSVLAAVAMVVAASFAVAPGNLHAQPAPDIVVTSPHVWQPGGSAPPYGVRLLPGASAVVELSFTNTTPVDVPRHRPRLLSPLPSGNDRAHYQFLPASDPRCGGWTPASPGSNLAYTLDVGPLPAGATIVCRWEVRRTVPGGGDLVLDVPGLTDRYLHVGAINDMEVSMEQLTPMTAGVSRVAQFRLTVRNPGPVDFLTTPRFGLCTFGSPVAPAYRPAGPEPCEVAEIFCFPPFDTRGAIRVGAVPAGQTRSCTFSLNFNAPVQQVGQFAVPTQWDLLGALGPTGNVFDPNPSNNQRAPLLTVGPAEVSLFGDRDERVALMLALGMLLVVAAWYRLRQAG